MDRSVTGLVAQQQCVGPLHTPLADVAVVAQSHFATTGIATAVGKHCICIPVSFALAAVKSFMQHITLNAFLSFVFYFYHIFCFYW